MPDPTLDIDVIVSGTRRRVLTLKEKKNGDSFIFFSGPPFEEKHPIKEHRYTIHPSRDDPSANLIKFTRKFNDGEKNDYLSTPVIKGRDGFVSIVIHCCDGMTHQTYNSRNRPNSVTFTEYDRREGTLIFSLFVGHADLSFQADTEVIALDKVMNSCRLIMLYKVIHSPSTRFAYTLNNTTFRTAESGRLPVGARSGMSSERCVEYFHQQCIPTLISRDRYAS